MIAGDVDYGPLGLSSNPFAFTELVRPGDDPVGAYLSAAVALECERVWLDLVAPDGPEPVVWLAPAEAETMRADILFIAALVRRLSVDPRAGVLPIYINTQLVYAGFMQGIANAVGDRLAPREFRRCLFALARGALDEVVSGTRAAPELEGLDPAPYRDMLAEGRLREFSKALFPPMPAAADADALQKQLDELSPEEAASTLAERQAREEEWQAAKVVRRKLRAFLDRLVDEVGLGPAVTAAAHEGLRTGFSAVQPFMVTGDAGQPHADNLYGMIKLARAAYRRVLLLLDQADCIVEFTEPERAALVGGIAEVSAVCGRDAQWIVRGPRGIYEMLGLADRAFVKYRETEALVPEPVRVAASTTAAEVEDLIQRFFALHGADPDSLLAAGVLEGAAGDGSDVLAALTRIGLAIEAAAARGAARVEVGDLVAPDEAEPAQQV